MLFGLLSHLQVAEFIDERLDEVKLMEEFRTNSKWKLLGGEGGSCCYFCLNVFTVLNSEITE